MYGFYNTDRSGWIGRGLLVKVSIGNTCNVSTNTEEMVQRKSVTVYSKYTCKVSTNTQEKYKRKRVTVILSIH